MPKCKICKQKFTPKQKGQFVCSYECAFAYVKKQREKKQKKKDKVTKEKLKSRGQWLRETQSIFNKFIRERDKGKPCISCLNPNPKKVNAGHYRSVGGNPELRFEPLNVWLQCEYCNNYLHGNLINYRINLIKRIGIEKVEWLEGVHEPKKYTIEELKYMKILYKSWLKELES